MADKSIGELQTVSITDLPVLSSIFDDTYIPAELQGAAYRISGKLWKSYAMSAITDEVEKAEAASDEAKKAAESATIYVGNVTLGTNWAQEGFDDLYFQEVEIPHADENMLSKIQVNVKPTSNVLKRMETDMVKGLWIETTDDNKAYAYCFGKHFTVSVVVPVDWKEVYV